MKISHTILLLLILFLFCPLIVGAQEGKVQSDEITKIDGKLDLEDLEIRLKPIKANFSRINSIQNWTKIDSIDTWETLETGIAKFYYQNNNLEKIITQEYGETFQLHTEYYLMNGQLSFVFEKLYKYNRPFYDEEFDFDLSEIFESRNYFENGKLVHQALNPEKENQFNIDSVIEEEKRIKTSFYKLIKNNQL